MRVKIVIVMFLFSFSLINAQESVSSSVFKQEAGDKSLEVNFDPGSIFGSNSGSQFGLFDGGIKYRSFRTENTAYRVYDTDRIKAYKAPCYVISATHY